MTKYLIVKKRIDEMDFYSLISGGAPGDEFDNESREISDKITYDQTEQDIAGVIAEVFNRSFAEREDVSCFADCARKIYADLQSTAPICLETKRLILRDYQENDKPSYFKLKSDPKVMYYLQDIQLFSEEEADTEFENVLKDQKSNDRKFYFLHIEFKDSREPVGSIGYTVIDNTPVGKLVHAGYFIFPQFWNHGYVTEAFKKVLEFAFVENNVYRVSTGCLAENAGSEKVMKKCGLIKEAEHVDWEWHEGKMKTRLEYRLLKNEWNNDRVSYM